MISLPSPSSRIAPPQSNGVNRLVIVASKA
jgi:hypothetical protein